MVREERLRAFSRARDSVITLQERERHGIGMQSEKTLHAVLKDMEEPDRSRHDIPVDGCIADIFREEDGVIEIQTAHLYLMKKKLTRFLKRGPVRIVHPIPHEKQIILVDPMTGHPVRRTRSPKKGTFYDAFRELFGIRPFLTDPNLTLAGAQAERRLSAVCSGGTAGGVHVRGLCRGGRISEKRFFRRPAPAHTARRPHAHRPARKILSVPRG